MEYLRRKLLTAHVLSYDIENAKKGVFIGFDL